MSGTSTLSRRATAQMSGSIKISPTTKKWETHNQRHHTEHQRGSAPAEEQDQDVGQQLCTTGSLNQTKPNEQGHGTRTTP
jgi:hypothetical protein